MSENSPQIPLPPSPEDAAAQHTPQLVGHYTAALPGYPPPGWVPVKEEIRELAYHRLAFSDAKNRWWKPLAELAVGTAIFLFLLFTLILFGSFTLDAFYPELGGFFSQDTDSITSLSFSNPIIFSLFFGLVAILFPALLCARLIFGPRPWGLVHSVAGRMRWGWLLTCTGIAVCLYVVVPFSLESLAGIRYQIAPRAQGSDLIWLLVLLFLLVPVQAYAEELVFRGYLMQSLGRWLKHPLWAIALPAPLFMLAHNYDFWGQLSVISMGLLSGYLAWRTGGLEASIALHVVNNLVAMGMGILGAADPLLQEGSDFLTFAIALVTELLFVAAVLWAHKRRQLERVRPVIFRLPQGTELKI